MHSYPVAVAIYCRISLDRNLDERGVQRQEAECRAWCERRGWPVAGVYVDNDQSAWSTKKRANYERMLADAEAGHVDGIVAWNIDRLTRRPSELERFITLADKHGLALGTVQGDIDLSTVNGRIMARTLGAFAAGEVENKSIRQKAENLQRVQEGGARVGGGRAFGYERDGVHLNEREANAIRDATKHVLEGGSLASIMRKWNAEGLRTTRRVKAKQGEPQDDRGRLLSADGEPVFGTWGYPSLTGVLTRWKNAGVVQHHGEPVEGVVGQWEPIVSKEDLLAVRSILSDPARRTNKDTALKYVLSGIITCAEDGTRMRWGRTRTRAGRDYENYVCRCEEPRCRRAVLRDIAEDVVFDHVAERLSMPDSYLLQLTADDRGTLAAIRAERAQVDADEDEVNAANISLKTKLAMLEDLQARRAELDGRAARMRQRDALTSLLADLTQVTQKGRSSLARAMKARDEVRERFAALDLDRQRMVIRALLTVSVVPSEKGVRPTPQTARKRVCITPLNPMTGEPYVAEDEQAV